LVASTTRKKNIFGFSLCFWGRKRENSALTEEPSPAGQKNILKERKILSVFLWLFFAALNIYICGFLLHLKISTGLWNCLLSSVIVFTTLRHQTLQLMQLRHEKFILIPFSSFAALGVKFLWISSLHRGAMIYRYPQYLLHSHAHALAY
jgi:hypothetical protein